MHARTTTRGVLIAALAMLLALTGASAASAIVPGGLVPIGCVTSGAVAGCVTAHDLNASTNVVVSPDGRNVYALSSTALVTFNRDASTGQLAQMPGAAGCLHTSLATADCRQLTTLSGPTDIVITPDGSSVYVSNSGTSTILEFDRDAAGVLTPKAGATCVAALATVLNGCADARAMTTPQRMVIDPTGRFLYVASSNGAAGGVTGLAIGAGGALSQLQNSGGLSGCVQQTNGDDCNDGRALTGASAIAMSPDGSFLYVASSSGRSLAVILRNPANGLLAMSTAANGCVEDAALDGCTNVLGELTTGGGINEIATVGAQLYVTLTAGTTPAGDATAARVLTFDRSGEGIVRRAGTAGCVSNGAAAGCQTGRALAAPTSLIPTADGQDVYVAAGGVAELDRNGDGSLTPRGDARGCIWPSAAAACTTLTTLANPAGVAVSPDGHTVYAVANTTGRISVLKRDSNSPVCENVTINVTAGTAPALPLPCRDEDGDALSYQIITPPTLGSLGALDSGAGTVIYAAPQGQNGTTTFTVRAAYTSFATFEALGSVTVNVVGAVPSGLDNDKDGFFAGQDCNDNNAAIRPGATEIKGNRIDENCDGVAEPFLLIPVGVSHGWDFKQNSVILTLKSLLITQSSPKGLKVEIRCKGAKCPFKTKKLKLAKARKGLRSVLASLTTKQRRFRAGQTVEVWVSAPNFNTKVARLPLKKGKPPVTQTLCVAPGEKTPKKSCS